MEVGSDAFDYGLLIGHEDAHRLIGDETADIWVTFPHRTIQEFLGTLYFLLMLDEGREIEDILGNDDTIWIFMKNPLFLQFCLWLLHNGEKYFNFQRGQDTYNQLVDFCVKKFNNTKLDLKHIKRLHPAFNLKSAYDRNDILYLNYLSDIFANCDRTSRLIVNNDDPLDWVLAQIVNEVTCIGIAPYPDNVDKILISYVTPTDIIFKISQLSSKELSTVLMDCAKTLGGNRSVSLYLDKPYSLSENNIVNLERLFVKCQGHDNIDLLLPYPHLTHLCLTCVHTWKETQCVFNDLSEAARRGHFPLLYHLSLVNCTRAKSRIAILFESVWPQLRHLNLLNSELLETDLEALCSAANSPMKTLPNLISLFLSIPDKVIGNLFSLPLVNLQRFYIDCLLTQSEIHDSLCDAIRLGKLENLITLVIQVHPGDRQTSVKLPCVEELHNLKSLCLRDSHSEIQIPKPTLLGLTELGIYSCRQLTASMSTLFSQQLQFLETLTLQSCNLNSRDLITLRRANLERKLPNLKHLDLSGNEVDLSKFRHLFGDSCTWNQLLSLNIMNSFGFNKADNAINHLNTVVGQGGLSSLLRLGIDYYKNTNTIWPKLEKIHILQCNKTVLRKIIKIRSDCLPELHTLCIVRPDVYNARLTRKLSEMGVSCHKYCAPWDDPFEKCHCEET